MRLRAVSTAAVLLAALVISVPQAAASSAAAAGGGHAADFTGDGLPDVLARERGTGKLKVYPHSGTFNGTATYPSVVTINLGWQSMRWIGAADVTGDGFADVVAIDSSWRMVVAVHSGVFNGTSTLRPGLVVVGYNWNVNDVVSVFTNGGAHDSIIARRASDGKLFTYANYEGLRGTDTFAAPESFNPDGGDRSWSSEAFIGMAPVQGFDGPDDVVYITANGELWYQSPRFHSKTLLGYGWSGVQQVVLTNLDDDNYPDIIARDRYSGNLLAYMNTSGPSGRTYVGPTVIGYGWQTNDIIA